MKPKRDVLTVDDLSPDERHALRARVEEYKRTGRMGSRTLPPVTVRQFALPLELIERGWTKRAIKARAGGVQSRSR